MHTSDSRKMHWYHLLKDLANLRKDYSYPLLPSYLKSFLKRKKKNKRKKQEEEKRGNSLPASPCFSPDSRQLINSEPRSQEPQRKRAVIPRWQSCYT